MPYSQTIARPYAKAAYAYASDNGKLKSWSAFLESAERFCADEKVKVHLTERGFFAQLENWLDQYLTATRTSGLEQQERNFLRLLDAHERITILADIAREFRHLRNASEGICEARVYTAKPLHDEAVKRIRAFLAQKTDRKVTVTIEEAPDLLAGVRIEYDGLVIDQSAKARIAEFGRKIEESRK